MKNRAHEQGLNGGGASLDAQSLTRQAWELNERVTELESELAEQVERARVRELEISALHKDVALKTAYHDALERSAAERQQQIEWFHAHVNAQSTQLTEQVHRAEHAEKMWHAAVAELAAERARISYRIAQRLIAAAKRRRLMFGLISRAMRVRLATRQNVEQ
jgi:hypothetical protein